MLESIENGTAENAVFVPRTSSQTGTVVYYGSDGYIVKIENGIEPEVVLLTDIDIVPFMSDNDLIASGWALMYVWGAHNNRLFKYIGQNKYIGKGRATTFDDTIGQANIVLSKGSVATKLAYDNPPVGTTVYVTADTAWGGRRTVEMTKNDAGGMPDAIVDIWKTGVEYWGYTWNTWFSLPGETEIYHE